MSKVGILAVILRTLGLIALLLSPWWYVGVGGFLALAAIREQTAPENQFVLVRSTGIRMATEVIFLFVGAWGISTLPFLAEQDRLPILQGAAAFAAFTLLWHPFLFLVSFVFGFGRRLIRGY
ncbi:MAG: hypothetical protein ABA06_04575 [Parcubacteria bacterium C7867-001]|nr:MAG: hypothetical protein ABA06_04575 [Parcubacteria bacterium C7867-001]